MSTFSVCNCSDSGVIIKLKHELTTILNKYGVGMALNCRICFTKLFEAANLFVWRQCLFD